MSRYIRTKNRLYELGGETRDGVYILVKVKGGWDYLSKKEPILKKADTVEELLDAKVKVFYDGTRIICPDISTKTGHYTLYGSIWIKGDKGEPILVSVAKQNEKGEFELL